MSGLRSFAILAQPRQSAPITRMLTPAYSAGSTEPVSKKSFARTAHASRASSTTPRTAIASAVAVRERRRSSEAIAIVAIVIAPMMSARTPMPHVNHA